MTLLDRSPSTQPEPTASTASLRRTAMIAGGLYLLTFVTSIPTLPLFAPAQLPGFVLGPGPDSGVIVGALLNVVCALAGVGTAVVLFPVVRRRNEALAIGFVASRVIEGTLIVVGVVALLSLVTLRQDLGGAATGAGAASLLTTGTMLVTVHGWSFVLGQSLMPVVNALLLGTLMYRSRLVPRAIPVLGLIGAPLLLASVVATVCGVFDQVSPVAAVAALPIAVWEFSLGAWLLVKGFTTPPVAGLGAPPAVPARHEP
ncbi:MAG: DUF4386 domain-containing protein [Pseudonocardia sediminis]